MPWLPLREAADALEKTINAIQSAGYKGHRQRRRDESGAWVYLVTDDELAGVEPGRQGSRRRPYSAPRVEPREPDASAKVWQQVEADREAHESGRGEWQERDGYIYDGERDVYVVTLPGYRAPFVRSGEWVRNVWRSYTSGSTIAVITREFEIDRKTFEAFKRVMGLTKTRAPWTDEELAAAPANDLYADALRVKEREVLSKVERAHWRSLKEDAIRWRRWRTSIREAVADLQLPRVAIPRVKIPDANQGGGAVVVGLTDLHVGKRAAGQDHTLAEQCEQLAEHVARCIETAAVRYGVPDAWIVPVGSDLVHVDSAAQTTTNGTAQGAQSVGSTSAQQRAALALMASAIDQLATTAPVRAVYVRGNHDAQIGFGLALALAERYRSTDRVEVDCDEAPIKFVPVGDAGACAVLWHGDGMPYERMLQTVRFSAPAWVNYHATAVYHGHWHHYRADPRGLPTFCLDAPSSTDDWHRHSGFVSRPGITLVRHDDTGWTSVERVA